MVTLTFKVKLALKLKKIGVIPCECDKFLTIRNFSFKLEMCINHLKGSDYLKTGDLDLEAQIGL